MKKKYGPFFSLGKFVHTYFLSLLLHIQAEIQILNKMYKGWYALNWDDEVAYFNDTQLHSDRAMNPKRYKMTFEDCVLAQDPACSYPIGSLCSFRDGEKSYWSQVIDQFVSNMSQASYHTIHQMQNNG